MKCEKLARTARGLAVKVFKDIYHKDCSLQESSLATADAIWLGVEYRGTDHPRMHLDRALVKELLPYLQKFVKTGRLD